MGKNTGKIALQLFAVVLFLLALQLFDSLNNPQLPSTIQITGAVVSEPQPITGTVVSESQATQCAETSQCKSPTSWKCQSNSKCYDYSDCVFQCPSGPAPEKKEEQPQPCVCGDWRIIGGCGTQDCPQVKKPQFRSCTGGSSCKNENRCVESDECKMPEADKMPEAEKGAIQQPDLIVASAEASPSIDSVPTTLSVLIVTVKNIGAAKAQGFVEVKASIRNNDLEICNDARTEQVSIEPNGMHKFSLNPTWLITGSKCELKDDYVDYTAKAQADTTKAIAESRDGNNELTVPLKKKKGLPDLVVESIDVQPKLDSLPTSISSLTVTVKNTGSGFTSSYIQHKVSILKNNVEICKGIAESQISLDTGKTQKFAFTPRSLPDEASCLIDDKTATYAAVVELDTGWTTIRETHEDNNKFTTTIRQRDQPVEPVACALFGSRQAGNYYDIFTGKWESQKEAGQPCYNNFECRTELCVKGKCVTDAQKEQILKIIT